MKKQAPSRFDFRCIRFTISGTKFDLVSIGFNYWDNDFGKHIDKPIMSLCLMGRWCLQRQCGHNFSHQGINDVTENNTSAAADGGLLERERQTWRERERITSGLSLIIHIIAHPLPKTHLHKSKKAIYHSRPKCTCGGL